MAIWSSYHDKQDALLSYNKVSEIMPVLEYLEEHEMFVCEGPYLGIAFLCQPTNGVSDQIRTSFQMMLTEEFPKGTLISMALMALPNIDNFLNGFRVLRGGRMSGSDGELADTRPGKDDLGNHRTAEQSTQLQTNQRDNRQHRITQCVTQYNLIARQAFCPCRSNIVLAQHFEQG